MYTLSRSRLEKEATDLDLENVRPLDTVLGSCFGLAVVDKETSTVRLIHYTPQEYLSRPDVSPDAHRTLGETCLTFLNYYQVKRLPADVSILRDTVSRIFIFCIGEGTQK